MTEQRSTLAVSAFLFDLDGTLLDTAPDLVAALNHVRSLEGLEEVDVAHYRQFVSQGAAGMLREGMPAADPEVMETRKRGFLEYYEHNSMVDTVLFDGVDQLLTTLEGQGIPWVVVTNKAEYLTLPIIRALGWHQRAAGIVCGDTLDRSKPDPAPVLLACELAGVAPDQAMMVGDDPRDLQAGDAAGATSVLVAYGYGAKEALASGMTIRHVVEAPLDLLPLGGLGLPPSMSPG